MERPTVEEWLSLSGMSEEELADKVGVQLQTVRKRRGEAAQPMPVVWLKRLGLIVEEDAAAEPESGGRESEQVPTAPPDGRVVSPPLEGIDLGAVAGYVEGAYTLAAQAVRDADPLLADAIGGHARQAGEAWARWIESEPKVAAFLQRLMVGTPAGEVIAVHVSIGFAYFVARSAVSRARRDLEEELAASEESEREYARSAHAGA